MAAMLSDFHHATLASKDCDRGSKCNSCSPSASGVRRVKWK